jgi:hypothetical protein
MAAQEQASQPVCVDCSREVWVKGGHRRRRFAPSRYKQSVQPWPFSADLHRHMLRALTAAGYLQSTATPRLPRGNSVRSTAGQRVCVCTLWFCSLHPSHEFTSIASATSPMHLNAKPFLGPPAPEVKTRGSSPRSSLAHATKFDCTCK